jgi:hypothetical protein
MVNSTGKSRGGIARDNALSAARKKEIASKGAAERWRKDIPRAEYSGEIHIGDLAIPCCVLEDGTRLLTQYGFFQAIGRSPRPAAGRGSEIDKVAPFLNLDNLKPFVSEELEKEARSITFLTDKGVRAHGFKAELLPKVCDVYLSAREKAALLPSQHKFAQACEIIMRGLAHVGIIALVDEATGFERDRVAGSLAKILEAFIAKELQPWLQTFPASYYEQLFRLRGLPYASDSVRRPQYFGVLTNDIVYKRIAPGVLDELKNVAERNEEGRPKHKYFQRLTANVGYPKLREHLGAVVAIMKLSDSYSDFIEKLDRLFPRYGETQALPLTYDSTKDTGQGI